MDKCSLTIVPVENFIYWNLYFICSYEDVHNVLLIYNVYLLTKAIETMKIIYADPPAWRHFANSKKSRLIEANIFVKN